MWDFIDYDWSAGEVVFYAKDRIARQRCSSLKRWMSIQCLQAGFTLEGMRKSMAHLLQSRKYLPMMLGRSPASLYLPTGSWKDPHLQLVRMEAIAGLRKEKDHPEIIFQDGLVLELTSAPAFLRAWQHSRLAVRLLYSQSSQ